MTVIKFQLFIFKKAFSSAWFAWRWVLLIRGYVEPPGSQAPFAALDGGQKRNRHQPQLQMSGPSCGEALDAMRLGDWRGECVGRGGPGWPPGHPSTDSGAEVGGQCGFGRWPGRGPGRIWAGKTAGDVTPGRAASGGGRRAWSVGTRWGREARGDSWEQRPGSC